MPSQSTPAAPGSGTSSADAVAAAIAQAKKEKRTAAATAASMAPRMHSQVQKWAKMTAELGGGQARDRDRGAGAGAGAGAGVGAGVDAVDGDSAGDGGAVEDDDGNDSTRPRKRTKTGGTSSDPRSNLKKSTFTSHSQLNQKQQKLDKALLPYAKQLRAPHRRDRYISFGVGRGLGKAADKTSTDTSTKAVPPTCLLCLARFDSRQQLRDHESLSMQHKRRLRDGTARKAAFQRFAKVEVRAGEGTETDDQTQETAEVKADVVRPPVHIKRIPRRRGDLAPTYTSYAAVDTKSLGDVGGVGNNGDEPAVSHACLLCRRRFQSLATLRLHERESALHRARTRVPELVAAAVAAVKAAAEERDGDRDNDGESARPLLKMRPSQTKGTSQYRDRARERRQAFGNTQAGGSKARDKDSESKKEEPAPANKGAALLSKMGWTAGQGLGALGGGLKEAIAPSAYRVGVGLGAQGGNTGDAAEVAARRTEADGGGGRTGSSYADFVEQAQNAARQRYMELDRAEAEAAAAAAAAAAELTASEPADADLADPAGEKMEVDY